MADNLGVTPGAGATLRTKQLASGAHAQAVAVTEGNESVPTLTGGTLVYTVDDSPAVALDPPTAGIDTARIRVWHATQDMTKRLYFRKDGTAPTADGANAEGYILHGEQMPVRLDDPTQFQMIGETSSGNFTVYVEWLLT